MKKSSHERRRPARRNLALRVADELKAKPEVRIVGPEVGLFRSKEYEGVMMQSLLRRIQRQLGASVAISREHDRGKLVALVVARSN